MNTSVGQSWWRNSVLFTGADAVNESIWVESPNIHLRHGFRPRDLSRSGRVGAQQAMFDPRVTSSTRRTTVVPWVPDLLGGDWAHPCALSIVGQSYAGFLDGYSNRWKRMPVHRYQNAGSWQGFQQSYVSDVVIGDLQYYEKLAPLLQLTGSSSRFAVFDIVRTSIVERGRLAGGKGPRQRYDADLDLRNPSHRSVFCTYCLLPESQRWTWERLNGSQSSVVVALGRAAACQLIHLLLAYGCSVCERNRRRVWTYSGQDWVNNCGMSSIEERLSRKDWYEVTSVPKGRTWHVVVVIHPSRENRNYAGAAPAVAAARTAVSC